MNTEYRIVLVNNTSEESSSPIAPTSSGGETPTNTSGKMKRNSLKEQAGGYVFYKRIVAPFVRQGLQYQIGTVALRTGDHELQARLQSAYDIGSQAVGLVENIAVGFMVGNVGGALAGALLSVAQTGVSLVQKYETFNLNKNLENTSLALMNVRAGGNVASTSGRRR